MAHAAGKSHGNYRHGMWNHPGYRSWLGAKDRCQSKAPKIWPHYGARGIVMAPAWADDFLVFWAAMGPSWFLGATLDRRSNDRGYEPGNCRWVPKSEQPRNRRMCPPIETPWGPMLASDAARVLGMSPCAFRVRLRARQRWDRLFAPPAMKGARVRRARAA